MFSTNLVPTRVLPGHRAAGGRRLLGTVSAVALVAGVLGLSGLTNLIAAPGAAMAADECGDPSANGAAPDNLVCAPGPYVAIDYTNTDGDLTLVLQDKVIVTTGGLTVLGDVSERIIVRTETAIPGAGDATFVNLAGDAINVQAQGPELVIDLTSADPAFDGATSIDGQGGLFAINTGGTLVVRMNEGSINGSVNGGLLAQAEGDVLVELTGGTSVTGATNGIIMLSNTGNANLTASGPVVSTLGDGITISAGGDVNAAIGDVQAASGTGIQVDAAGAANVVLSGNVVAQVGATVLSTGDFDATLTMLAGSSIEATGAAPYGTQIEATGTGSVLAAIDGDIIDGGLSLSTTSGNIVLTGSGDIVNTVQSGVEINTDLGFVDVIFSGDITGAEDGLEGTMVAGDFDVTLLGNVQGAANGVQLVGGSGGSVLTIGSTSNVSGAITGAMVNTQDGDAQVIVAGTATGATGVEITSGGTGNVSVSILEGGSVYATNGFAGPGVRAQAFGAGDVTVAIDGSVTEGGVRAFSSGTGDVTVTGGVNGLVLNSGVLAAIDIATVSGLGAVVFQGQLVSTGGDGINASSDSGALLIATDGGITAGEDGIDATSNSGAITISNSADIQVGGGSGIVAETSGGGGIAVVGSGNILGNVQYGIRARTQAGGDITVDYEGDIGAAGDPTAQAGISAVVSGGAGAISVTMVGDVHTAGGGVFGGGVAGVSFADSGDVTVAYQGLMVSGSYGVVGSISSAANGGNVTALVGEGSTIESQSYGVIAQTAGAGQAGVGIGTGVTLTAVDFGVFATSVDGDATVFVSDDVSILVRDTNADGFATGIHATSNRPGNAAPGDETVEIQSAANLSITIDDGSGGDADGATGIAGKAFGAGGDVSILARSVAIDITGNNSIGIESESLRGDIEIEVQGGTINIAGQDGTDLIGNHTRTAGISAVSASGDILINNLASINVANGPLTSTGIYAETAGTVGIVTGGVLQSEGDGIVSNTSGEGAVSIGIVGSVFADESAIAVTSNGGAVTVNAATGSTLVGGGGGASWVIDVANTAIGSNSLTVSAGAAVRSSDNSINGYDDQAIRVIGGGATLNNAGRINGVVDFSGLTGGLVFNNSGTAGAGWHTSGVSTFSGSADVLTNTGSIYAGAGGANTTLQFGGGTDTFNNAGALVAGEAGPGAATLTLSGLETWNNSGRIVFGGLDAAATSSDGAINDRIIATGATFNASGASRLLMDVNLGSVAQASCGTLTAADCFALPNGSTTGVTRILVRDASGAVFGGTNEDGIVLVDVTGTGATAAGQFLLDPGSDHWRLDANSADGVLDKGLFFYDLVLDGKQHKLVGLPDSEAFEFGTIGTAAQSVWYSTTGTWFERQADLRGQDGADRDNASVWMRMTGGSAERDITNSYDFLGDTYSFDTSYDQSTVVLTGGAEIGRGQWVLGGQVGYVDSDVTFASSPTLTSMEGASFGVYASYQSDGLFVDGIVNANLLDLEHQAPTLAPPGSTPLPSEVKSLGGQIEAGWTVRLGDSAFLEPVATLAYVKTEIDDIAAPGADIVWDDQISLRASLGARAGTTFDHDSFSSTWGLTARYWNEFEGENGVAINAPAPSIAIVDDFSGSFGEVAGSVGVTSKSGALSAYVNLGYRFNDDYQSVDGSVGFRWRW